jgi:hypothetical protein
MSFTAPAVSGYAANAGAVGARMGLGIGSGTAAGSAAASGFGPALPAAAKAGGFNFGSLQDILGPAIGVFGQIQAGREAASVYEYNAKVAEQNAAIALERGKAAAEAARRRARRFTGEQRGKYAASGVTFAGSPLEVMIDDAAEMELDALDQEYNAKIEALNAKSQAGLSLMRAQSARKSSYVSAGATLLSALPKVLRF